MPVIFQNEKHAFYVFNSFGVYQVKLQSFGFIDARQLSECLDPRTWVLVDSNEDVMGVSQYLTEMGFFVIQTASPRWERISWIGKISRQVVIYIMKPPTLKDIQDV